MKTIKRGSVLLLCALLIVSLAACGFESKLTGFIDATAFMNGERNVDTHVQMTFKTSEDAETVPMTEFINDLMMGVAMQTMSGETADGISYLKDIKIGFDIVSRTYEDGVEIRIGWVGADGEVEELISMLAIGTDLYIGTEFVRIFDSVIGAFLPPDMKATLAPLYEYDYIKVSIPNAAPFTEEAPELDITAILSDTADKMSDAFKENAARILTEDFDKALKEDDGAYTLSLNTESFMSLFSSVLELIAENSEDVAATLTDLMKALSIPLPQEINASSIKNAAEETLASVRSVDVSTLPNVNYEYTVKGVGSGDDKQLGQHMKLTIPEDGIQTMLETIPDISVLPEMLELEVAQVTKIQTAPIVMPTGKVIGIEELSALMDGGLFSSTQPQIREGL